MAHAQKSKIPPNPPLLKGGTTRNCLKSPPLKKGDLGGFENHQWEGTFGKRYKLESRFSRVAARLAHREESAAVNRSVAVD